MEMPLHYVYHMAIVGLGTTESDYRGMELFCFALEKHQHPYRTVE